MFPAHSLSVQHSFLPFASRLRWLTWLWWQWFLRLWWFWWLSSFLNVSCTQPISSMFLPSLCIICEWLLLWLWLLRLLQWWWWLWSLRLGSFWWLCFPCTWFPHTTYQRDISSFLCTMLDYYDYFNFKIGHLGILMMMITMMVMIMMMVMLDREELIGDSEWDYSWQPVHHPPC